MLDDESCFKDSKSCAVSFNIAPNLTSGQNYILGVRVNKLSGSDEYNTCSCDSLMEYVKWDYLKNYGKQAVLSDNQTTFGGNLPAWQMELLNNDNGYKTFLIWTINNGLGYRFLYSAPNDMKFDTLLNDFNNLRQSVNFISTNETTTPTTEQGKIPSFMSTPEMKKESEPESSTNLTSGQGQTETDSTVNESADNMTEEEKHDVAQAAARACNALNAILSDSGMATNDCPPVEGIVLVSERLKKGDGDYDEVVGQVKNIGEDNAEFIKIGFTGYDSNGDVVGTDFTYADADSLRPNQKSSFNLLLLKDDFEGMDSYDLSLQWRDNLGVEQYIENANVTK